MTPTMTRSPASGAQVRPTMVTTTRLTRAALVSSLYSNWPALLSLDHSEGLLGKRLLLRNYLRVL